MEEMNRTHKEPAWGWIGALLEGLSRRAASRPQARTPAPRRVVTPWSPHSPTGWSA